MFKIINSGEISVYIAQCIDIPCIELQDVLKETKNNNSNSLEYYLVVLDGQEDQVRNSITTIINLNKIGEKNNFQIAAVITWFLEGQWHQRLWQQTKIPFFVGIPSKEDIQLLEDIIHGNATIDSLFLKNKAELLNTLDIYKNHLLSTL